MVEISTKLSQALFDSDNTLPTTIELDYDWVIENRPKSFDDIFSKAATLYLMRNIENDAANKV